MLIGTGLAGYLGVVGQVTTVDEFVARASNHSVTVRTPETARLRELLLGTFGGRRGAVRDRRGMTALALGALLRNTAAAITTFVAVFFVIPPLTNLLPAWLTDHFVQFLPSNTGVVMVRGNFGVAHPLGALDRVRGDVRLRGGPDRVRRLAASPRRRLTWRLLLHGDQHQDLIRTCVGLGSE